MTSSTRSASATGLPEIDELPPIPAALELALYMALALSVATAWAGVLTVCFWGIS